MITKRFTLALLIAAAIALPVVAQSSSGSSSSSESDLTIDLVAKNIAFDAPNFDFSDSTIRVPAGATVTIRFNNQDTGIRHNFAAYMSSSADTVIFQGKVVRGPQTIEYTFDVPDQPGEYFFRCDVHPATMTGTFLVQSQSDFNGQGSDQ